MRVACFYHSLVSDWNHGNAHFLRGVVAELADRGHDVRVYEPLDAWSLQNLIAERGPQTLERFREAFPGLASTRYAWPGLDLDAELADVDLVLVHEWNDPSLVAAIGALRRRGRRFRALFHDTHHRSVTEPEAMARYDLQGYDGVLAFGEVIRRLYLQRGWTGRAWTWHEAADVRVFRPLPPPQDPDALGDLVWVGNWGDEERTAELRSFLIEPVAALGLRARVHGVRYPAHALDELAAAGIRYDGWVANHEVPRVFAAHRVTVHVPRRPYATVLPGIPTIRVFEALACGIPLVCAPWSDAEGLFTPGADYAVARDGTEMRGHLRALLNEPQRAATQAAHGLATVRARHTCAHRVDELLEIARELGLDVETSRRAAVAVGVSSSETPVAARSSALRGGAA